VGHAQSRFLPQIVEDAIQLGGQSRVARGWHESRRFQQWLRSLVLYHSDGRCVAVRVVTEVAVDGPAMPQGQQCDGTPGLSGRTV